MDTQVKERLTGAVILVTLFVLLVPELLTGSSKRASPQSEAAPDEPAVRTYSIDLVQGGVRQQGPSTEPDLAARALKSPESAADTTADLVTAAAEQATAQPQVVQPRATVSAPAPTAAVEVATPPPAEKKAVAVSERVAAAPVTAARVERPVAERTPASSGAGGWAVQLGSFASRDNAQRLVKQLKAKGFSAFLLDGGGTSGKLYRVRVGPQPDRAGATALAAKLRAAGHKGSVVAP